LTFRMETYGPSFGGEAVSPTFSFSGSAPVPPTDTHSDADGQETRNSGKPATPGPGAPGTDWKVPEPLTLQVPLASHQAAPWIAHDNGTEFQAELPTVGSVAARGFPTTTCATQKAVVGHVSPSIPYCPQCWANWSCAVGPPIQVEAPPAGSVDVRIKPPTQSPPIPDPPATHSVDVGQAMVSIPPPACDRSVVDQALGPPMGDIETRTP